MQIRNLLLYICARAHEVSCKYAASSYTFQLKLKKLVACTQPHIFVLVLKRLVAASSYTFVLVHKRLIELRSLLIQNNLRSCGILLSVANTQPPHKYYTFELVHKRFVAKRERDQGRILSLSNKNPYLYKVTPFPCPFPISLSLCLCVCG